MTQEKTANYHVWNSDEDLMAKVNTEVKFPSGGQNYAEIGQVAIKKGDALYFDHGRSMGVYTMSGRAYEPEFKDGKVSLHGCPVYLILNNEQSKNVKFVQTSKEEFDLKVENQKTRIAPEIEVLKDIYIFEETKRITEARAKKAEADKLMKEKIKGAITQMNQFFGQQPQINSEETSTPKPKKP